MLHFSSISICVWQRAKKNNDDFQWCKCHRVFPITFFLLFSIKNVEIVFYNDLHFEFELKEKKLL